LLKYRAEQTNIQARLKNLQEVDKNYYSTGIYLLKLANKAPAIFKSSEPDVKTQLIKLVLQNCVVKGKTLYATYKSPFSIFAKGASCHNWLPLCDAFRNHEIIVDVELDAIKLLFEEANAILT